MRVIATHPDTGEVLFDGPPSAFPLGGVVVTTTLPMPDGSLATVRRQASITRVADDKVPHGQ